MANPFGLCNPYLFYRTEQCKKMFPKWDSYFIFGCTMSFFEFYIPRRWMLISLLELLVLFSRCLRFTVYMIKIYSSFLTIFTSWLLFRIQVLSVCDPFWNSVQVSMSFVCKCRSIFFQTFLIWWKKRCGVNTVFVSINLCFSAKTLTIFVDLSFLYMYSML